MSFVYPSFLWALAALAIPVIIHLFNFRRTIRIYFSNTTLLRQVQQATTRQRQIKQWLILAARLLFVFFLVLAFAQPFLPASEQITSGRNVVIYVDNSYSMSAMADDKLRGLDLALQHARKIVDVFPTDTRYRLLTNDFAPFSNSYKTRDEIVDLLAQVRLSPIGRTLGAISNKVASQGVSEEVFLISDFQRSTLGPALGAVDSLRQWHLVQVRMDRNANLSVDSVYLENPSLLAGERNTIHARIRNSGEAVRDHITVRFALDGNQQGAIQIDAPPNGTTEAQFDLPDRVRNFSTASITVQDFPVTFDNEFYFALNSSQRLDVVEISPAGDEGFVSRVFGNGRLFNFRKFALSNVDFNAATQADLLIVRGIDRVNPFLRSIIARQRSATHSQLLVVPSAHPDVASYSEALGMSFNPVAGSTVREALAAPDFAHPLFTNVFEERERNMAMPIAAPVWSWGTDRSAPLSFSNGLPFLSSIGNLYLLASPLELAYTDLPNHALFVPVMYRMAASGKRNQQALYHFLTETFVTLAADSLAGEEPAKLKGDSEIIPPQRFAGGSLFLDIPAYTVKPGFYGVVAGKDTLSLLAFDADKRESMLAFASPEEVMALMGSKAAVSVFDSDTERGFGDQIQSRYLGTPLYKYMLILALLFLLAEVLLIRFMKSQPTRSIAAPLEASHHKP
ncbi:MAG: BatA domain-containing protein [Cyclobacteriaceae bacterium]